MRLPLSPQVFAITAHLIEERTGLRYGPANFDVLAERLSYRATELGLESLLDYYYYLRYDPKGPGELAKLIETLVVQETYFFRELEPVRVLVDSVIPEMLRDRSPLRIWCAACATGEEAYTLGIFLAEAGLLPHVDLVASDISESGLATARAGTYAGRALRVASEHAQRRHLIELPGGRVRVPEHLRHAITWKHVNLTDREAVAALGVFDIILCRNVLIYFSDDTVCRVAKNLGDVLRPRGWLLVGASESLLRFGTLFSCEERAGAFFYRKSVP